VPPISMANRARVGAVGVMAVPDARSCQCCWPLAAAGD